MNSDLKILLGFLIAIICLSLFYLLMYNFIAPRIALLFEKFTSSYKYCIKFIYSNEMIKEHLGEIRYLNSLPTPNYGRLAKYKFELNGVNNYAILNISLKLSREMAWKIYSVDLEIDRKVIDLNENPTTSLVANEPS